MTPSPPLRPAVDGPPVDASLLEWLDENAGTTMLDLPLHFADSLDLGRATLKSRGLEIALWIDSSALSMTLHDHLAGHCQGFPCTVWARGTWGPLLPNPALQPVMHPVFTVRAVVGPAPATASRIRLVP